MEYTENIIGKIHKISRLYHTNTIQLLKILDIVDKKEI